MDPEVADDVDTLDDSEDKYEDAGELDMSGAHENLYLTRMPKMLWEGLSKMHENDEVRIGTLRIEGDRLNPAKVSLMLDHSAEALKFVPREFNLRSTSKSSANTFVFSEKNLPGYRRRNAASKGIGPSSRQVPADKAKDSKVRGRFFRGPGYRKAIPKRTSLIGHVQSEFNCLPVETDHYANVLEQRARVANRPKHELQLLEANANQGTLMTAGAMGSNGTFNTFIKGYSQMQKKQQQQKATRMPKNELRDLLFDCFRSYKFWFIRDLKKRTQQPEPWLRECLEDIAELVRQGPFANTWRLKPSSNLDSSILDGATDLASFEMAEEGVAPDAVIDDGNSDFPGDIDDEDEKNIKMEDVRP